MWLPRRAVFGSLNHFNDKTKHAQANRKHASVKAFWTASPRGPKLAASGAVDEIDIGNPKSRIT
jgi:hypothetical protein